MPRSQITYMFPGQGAQYPSMAKLICQVSKNASRIFAEANEILNYDLLDLCTNGSEDDLKNTLITQPAIVTTSMALYKGLEEKLNDQGINISPDIFSGHSLGILTAAIASKSLTLKDGIEIASKRGEIMSKNYNIRPVTMSGVIGLNIDEVKKICNEATSSENDRVDVANYNLKNQIVISGHVSAVSKAEKIAQSKRAKVINLKVRVSSHTKLHIDESKEFADVINNYNFAMPDTPVLSNISSKILNSAEKIKFELSNQIHKPVLWYKNMETLSLNNINIFIEIGPGNVLSRLVKKFMPNVLSFSISKDSIDNYPVGSILNHRGEF